MIGFRPCGACAAYVPEASGCGHWHPAQKAERDRTGKGPQRANAKRDRDRARANAKRAVEEFRRTMTGET